MLYGGRDAKVPCRQEKLCHFRCNIYGYASLLDSVSVLAYGLGGAALALGAQQGCPFVPSDLAYGLAVRPWHLAYIGLPFAPAFLFLCSLGLLFWFNDTSM
jgi:hypothetical protein